MKREDVTELTFNEAQQMCICVCVYTLAHINTVSVLDVCMKLINHMLSNCVDVPRCVLRNGPTTHKAAGT